MSVPRFRRVNFGAYDNYVPVEDVSKKSWNQQHFSLMFSKPNRPGKKWRSTPSELRENSAMGDVVKDDQKATPMWMTRSLLKISEKPSAYLAARRRPPFFTGPQRTESTELSPGEKNQMYKKEKNQAEKTTKKKVAGLSKGSKTKQPDTADISSRESDSESKGSGESKPKESKDSHEDKEPEAETKDSDVSEKDTEKKRKPKESDAESTDSKNEKKSDKDSRKKTGDLDKTFKRKTKSSDFEFKDILKKDKDIKKKNKDLVIEATGLKKTDKDSRKKSKDFSIDYKNEKRDKTIKKKSKDSAVEFKDTKKKDESSKKRSKDFNNKSQNLKTEDKKPNEGDAESEYSYDSKMKFQKANIPKDSKKSKDGKITFKGSDTEPTKRESELDLETPKISRGTASIRSPMAPQALPQLVKSEIRKAPLPEAQWIQKLI